MEKRDFLLREIEKLTQLLKKLLDAVEAFTSDNVEIEFIKINEDLSDCFSFTFEELIEMKNSKLIDRLKNIDETNLELLATLILETTKKLHSINYNSNINTAKLAKKGIEILNFIDDKSKTFSIKRMNIKNELQKQTYH